MVPVAPLFGTQH